jgi:hypothetical protein
MSVAHKSHNTLLILKKVFALNDIFDNWKLYNGWALMTMAAKVAVFKPNFVVVVKLAVARLPPGADVVSIIAYV